MAESKIAEQFSKAELVNLRMELMQRSLDHRQAAELLSNFLNGRGYGVHPDDARDIVGKIDLSRCDIASIQTELQRVAMVM
jgi:hypothetical protein